MPSYRKSDGVRELCDSCQTTIYNLHLFCPDCGFAVCPQCIADRNRGQRRKVRKKRMLNGSDAFGWLLCTNAARGVHWPSQLYLAQLIPDPHPTVLHTLTRLDGRRQLVSQKWRISQGCVCDDETPTRDDECRCEKPTAARRQQNDKSSYLCDGKLLVLHEPDLALFQRRWKDSWPIVVSNTDKRMNPELWTPASFRNAIKDSRDQLHNSIVDCKTGKAVGQSVSLDQFWDGFEDFTCRQKDAHGQTMYLKLKDYPAHKTFKEALPQHFEDLCNALPMPEYTAPELEGSNRAQYNLVTRLPSHYVRPDLGPKMYNAYGMTFYERNATTNLHCDITDAVNLMANVTVPKNIDESYIEASLLQVLVANGFDEQSDDYVRVRNNWRQAGAIWTIFHPNDGEAIKEFIRDLPHLSLSSGVFNKDLAKMVKATDDPIHDQRFFLGPELRNELKLHRGVEGCTFVQMKGDAVFIPAGAAHQVQNLLSCIKVAEDFVSPEGVMWSLKITEDFRQLTDIHENHEDKLQLSNILHHSICDAVGTLE